VYQNAKAKISESLSGATKISICADIWSKPGMTAFLGITSHYFSSNDNQHHTVTLAVCNLPSPHTGEKIPDTVEDILLDWNLPKHHIFCILTDNGSNMVAAFKNRMLQLLDYADTTNEEDAESETTTNSEVNNSEDEKNDDKDTESTSDMEFDSEQCISNEISNFEQTEENHNEAFMSFKQISCFIHSQL